MMVPNPVSPSEDSALLDASGKKKDISTDHVTQSGSKKTTTISNLETFLHILTGNLGLGVLALPKAIGDQGLMLGTGALIVISLVCIHCMVMLVNSSQKAVLKRGKDSCQCLSYGDTAMLVFEHAGDPWEKNAKTARNVINIVIFLSQVSSNAVYVVFVSQNMQAVLNLNSSPFLHQLEYHHCVLLLLPPIIIICLVRELRYLSPFSTLATLLQVVGLVIVFYYIFRDPLPHSETVPWVTSLERMPIFFGIALFTFDGILVVLPVENQMRHPEAMPGVTGVLTTSMIMVTVLCVSVGFYGYLKYGEEIQSTINLNLPRDDLLAQSVMVMYAISIFLSYTLQFYVLMDILGPSVIKMRVSEQWYSATEYAVRVGMNVFIFGLAACCPWLDLVASLQGALITSTMAIMAPAVIDVASNWDCDNSCVFRLILLKNAFIFALGLFGCIVGTYSSVLGILQNFGAMT